MNLKAIQAFCLVMRRGRLAAAADEMHLSQPAVSRLIANLEHELKMPLFHRDRRALRPTAEGAAFYREAWRILDGVDRLKVIAGDIRVGHGARLRVVVLSRLAVALVAPAARLFRDALPDVGLTLEMHHRRDMERWLSGRQFDLGVGPLPVDDPRLDVEPLGTREAVVALAPDHPLASKGVVDVSTLAREPLIALTPDTLLQQQIDAIFAGAGYAPHVAQRTSSSLLACALAGQGLGYTITDPFTAASLPQQVAVAALRPAFTMAFGVLTPRDQPLSDAARAFRDCVARVFPTAGR